MDVGTAPMTLLGKRISLPTVALPTVKLKADTVVTAVLVTIASAIVLPLVVIMIDYASDPLPYIPGERIENFAARREARKEQRGYY